jgi:hypothetical protein
VCSSNSVTLEAEVEEKEMICIPTVEGERVENSHVLSDTQGRILYQLITLFTFSFTLRKD